MKNPPDVFSLHLQIKRPYFHVKPLDRLQLRAWHSYLDWEIAQLNKDASQDPEQGNYLAKLQSDVSFRFIISFVCVGSFWHHCLLV